MDARCDKCKSTHENMDNLRKTMNAVVNGPYCKCECHD